MKKQKEQDLQLYLYLSSWKESLKKTFKIWWTFDLCVPRTGQMDRTYCSVFLNLVNIYLVIGSWACKRGRKWSYLTLNGRPGYESGCQFQAQSHNSVLFFSFFPKVYSPKCISGCEVISFQFSAVALSCGRQMAFSVKPGCKLESTSEKLQLWLWQENQESCISFVFNSMIAFSRPVSKIWIYMA